MDQATLARRLMDVFLSELDEHVRALNDGLLALEKHPGRVERVALVTALLRSAHSLKGAAGAVGVRQIETLCHGVEEILGTARDGSVTLGPNEFKTVYEAVDAIAAGGARLREQRDGSGPRDGSGENDRVEPVAASFDTGHVRVPVDKLDDILARGGELLLARNRLGLRVQTVDTLHRLVDEWKGDAGAENIRRLERELKRLGVLLAQDLRALDAVAGGLDHEVRSVRMLPLGEACAGLERIVRDLALAGGKAVDLTVDGGHVALDRTVIDAIRDPLAHLVRNAVDHGIETPAERAAAGKPARGRVRISAALRGSQVEIVLSDDGRGLDLDAIRTKARASGLAVAEDDRAAAQLIFLPGFSTTRRVTEISGRGVGLDVVRSKVARLNGAVDVSFEPGAGTRFTFVLPLTLTCLRALLVRDGGCVYAFDASSVARVLSIRPGDVRTMEGYDAILTGAAPLPLVTLAHALGLPVRGPATEGKRSVIVLATGGREAAFSVEELLAEQEIFIKHIGVRLGRVGQVTGATIMPDGSVALILSAAGLVGDALDHLSHGVRAGDPGESSPLARKRLLIVDDSITTRTLMDNILGTAGYDVTVTVDGAEAWAMLQERGSAIDLVVSDVEMPRMDGFALTQAIRSLGDRADLPVVLVTARSSDQDKARGMEVGANAYLVKSAFDQRALLDVIAHLL
jgi:two-component system chemotaxis sensor kinase CheA